MQVYKAPLKDYKFLIKDFLNSSSSDSVLKNSDLNTEDLDMILKEANYKLAILSNGTPGLLNQLVKSNDLENIFDDIFSIEEVGIYKPDSKVYDIPIKKYRVQKSQILFLSANTWDVSGAGNYGYNSVWVNRNNNIFDNLDYKPSRKIKSLDQLHEII